MQPRTERLREAARRLGSFTLDEVFEAAGFGLPTGKERTLFRRLLHDMRRSGELKWFDTGTYKYFGKMPKEIKRSRVYPLQEKMWRVVRNLSKRQAFSRFDVQQLSGASGNYTRRYLWFLKKEKFIVEVAQERYLTGTNFRPLYRVMPGMDTVEAPHFLRRHYEKEQRKKRAEIEGDKILYTLNHQFFFISGGEDNAKDQRPASRSSDDQARAEGRRRSPKSRRR